MSKKKMVEMEEKAAVKKRYKEGSEIFNRRSSVGEKQKIVKICFQMKNLFDKNSLEKSA